MTNTWCYKCVCSDWLTWACSGSHALWTLFQRSSLRKYHKVSEYHRWVCESTVWAGIPSITSRTRSSDYEWLGRVTLDCCHGNEDYVTRHNAECFELRPLFEVRSLGHAYWGHKYRSKTALVCVCVGLCVWVCFSRSGLGFLSLCPFPSASGGGSQVLLSLWDCCNLVHSTLSSLEKDGSFSHFYEALSVQIKKKKKGKKRKRVPGTKIASWVGGR